MAINGEESKLYPLLIENQVIALNSLTKQSIQEFNYYQIYTRPKYFY